MTHSSARGRLVAAARAVERHERSAVAASFLLFFCIMAGFFAVRPVRDTVGTLIGADRLANLWIGTAAASVMVIPVYGWIVARFRRSVFLPWTYGGVAVALAIVGLAFRGGGTPGVWLSQFFWIFISVLNLFTISVFWSFLLEVFRSEQTKRLFGIVAAGGTTGALAGPLFTDFAVSRIGNSGVLFLGAGFFALAILCQKALLIVWRPETPGVQTGDPTPDEAIGGSMWAGVPLVLQSRYVLNITLFVVLISAVSTFLYFDQLRLVTDAYPDVAARTQFFARLDWIVQSLTIVSQLFLTGLIASRVGLVALLTMVPIATAFAFAALAAWNTLPVVAASIVIRRFGQFAFVRPGREMLWSALDKETKYKAKNFVDVSVYRGADAFFAQFEKGFYAVGFGSQAVAIVGVVTAAIWAVNGWWLGRQHDAANVQGRADPPSSPAS